MKILCLSCDRLAELGSYRVDAGVLVLSCSRCGAEMRAVETPPRPTQSSLEASTSSSSAALPSPRVVQLRAVGADPAALAAQAGQSADPFAAPEGTCPKCIAPRAGGDLSCNQCGLTFVNFVKRDVTPPQPLDSMWQELLANWHDVSAHDRLLVVAVTQAALPSIARLYQIRLAASPDDPLARRGRDEVLRLATVSATAFTASPGTVPDKTRSFKIGVLIVGVLMLIMLSTLLIRQLAAAAEQ